MPGYVLLSVELQERRKADSEPVGTAEPISFDEWSRKCALQITLCYPDFREKAKYIWDSARETQHVAPALVDDVSIFEAAIEECKKCNSIDEHAWNHGVLAVIAEYESCRAAMLQAGNSPTQNQGWISVSERMPKMGQEVLCTDQFENYETALYDAGYIPGPPFFATTAGEFHPTHWMPLPAGPREVKGE
ncbi:DUF551 domain-containing protein [Klebsiella pneumoniae]|nr:DUF551 domain-containing protein [Klebsiella pneumoniae]MBM2750246.1 DUF551 domain-containing protein [Klebsiella pneumoniae]MBM6416057.1 DUF551 domain-containing protein [Klebsiella pneumoniae]MBM6434921.1 DUF551 domain-containing protein [Klebsiella pneumoniae]HBQ5766030.1 DUF551 domain-containing protein [Klebsiella pneumoniae subsp. pneumoniae]